MIKTTLVNGKDDIAAVVSSEGAVNVVTHPHPPKDESLVPIPYRDYFRDPDDSLDMAVNGSSTNVQFCICADPEVDIHVKSVSITIADAGAALNEFGAITALSNGVLFEWVTQDIGTVTIHEGLKVTGISLDFRAAILHSATALARLEPITSKAAAKAIFHS